MAGDGRVVVTRPDRQGAPLRAALSEQGFEVLSLPMLEVTAVDPLAPADRQLIFDLDHFEHLIFVSANAVSFGLDCFADVWPQHPEGQTFWAVGEATAQALAERGFSARRPEQDMSSEGLLAMPGLQTVSGQRILIVKGEGGRGLLAETLSERGARVRSLHCYRRAAARHEAQPWIDRLSEPVPTLLLLSSGEGLTLLSRLLHPREHTNLASHTVLAPSPRVAEQARGLGWKAVRSAANAADATMVEAARAWRSRISRENQL